MVRLTYAKSNVNTGGWGRHMGILHHRGFREAFLEDVMTEESGGAKNKSIPGMQWGSSPRSCDNYISEASEACWGGTRGGGHTGRRGVLGKLNFPPTMLLHLFTISLIYSFIHSFVQQISSMSQTLHHAREIKQS